MLIIIGPLFQTKASLYCSLLFILLYGNSLSSFKPRLTLTKCYLESNGQTIIKIPEAGRRPDENVSIALPPVPVAPPPVQGIHIHLSVV